MSLPSEEKNAPQDIGEMIDLISDKLFDILAEAERKDFHSNLESFEMHKEKNKAACVESMSDYYQQLTKGYEVILSVIEEDLEKKNPKKVNMIKI